MRIQLLDNGAGSRLTNPDIFIAKKMDEDVNYLLLNVHKFLVQNGKLFEGNPFWFQNLQEFIVHLLKSFQDFSL